jgi:hypothetical protein
MYPYGPGLSLTVQSHSLFLTFFTLLIFFCFFQQQYFFADASNSLIHHEFTQYAQSQG